MEDLSLPKKGQEGFCHLCGRFGPLSYEHVPPRSAFNDRSVIESPWLDDLQRERGKRPKNSRVNQRGVGAYTLCRECNSLTGKWYGPHFARWVRHGADLLETSRCDISLTYLHYLLPLSVLKQIITMNFSINHHKWREEYPELEHFVRNRNRTYLDPKHRFFLYFNYDGGLRRIGGDETSRVFARNSQILKVSEISHPPFGYVHTTDGSHPDRRLFEITHFKNYRYDEFSILPLRLQCLPTHLGITLDYRSYEEIYGEPQPLYG